MEVTETKAEGLSRSFKVVVPASELQAKLDARIEEIRPQMQLKGFRPGKVPASHVKKMYGKSIMGELIEGLVGETNQKAIEGGDFRPASQPDIELDGSMDDVIDGTADLAYSMHVDIMPEFEPISIDDIKLERPVCEISDEEVQESLERLAEQNKKYEARDEGAEAQDGDALVIDFVGKIDGEAFDGGTADDQTIVLGQGRFIPGFEEQLVGAKAGDERELKVTVPDDYAAENLKGKDALFDVTVKEVQEPADIAIDDEFAVGFGLDDLDSLKDMMRTQLKTQYDGMSRQKAKRSLLDVLDDGHSFDLPPKMVSQEFDQIWEQLLKEKEAGNLTADEAKKSDDELKEEYRKIAERRVRLGLVLAEIGRVADVKISQEEEQQALIREARNYPGQEREVIEFFQKNPNAMAQLRAPIYEDKVVDHILETAEVTDKTVSKEELMADDEDE